MWKAAFFFLASTAWAQTPLSLKDAVRLALAGNPAMAAAAESSRAARAQVDAARSGRLPKLNYSESWVRSDNPVFVFSSLLTQHQFGPENFAINTLNRPGFLNNFQSLVTLNQPIYDGGQTRHAVKAAELGRQMTDEEKRRVQMELVAGAARAYYGAILAGDNLKAAEQAVRSAEADLTRAESIHAAGMSTEVDVLSIRVHLAAVNEERIQRAAQLDVARAALNDVLGLELDTPHQLTTPLTAAETPDESLADAESGAAQERPEMRESRLNSLLARNQVDTARTSLRPEVGLLGAFEADRQDFVTKGGANWTAGISMKWNLFNGLSDKARIEAAAAGVRRADAETRRADSAVRLQVRQAWADLRAAEQRIEVAKASVAEAEESLRITQNRYEAGMSNVTDLLRTETAVLESRTRYLAAVHDQRVAAIQLELAAGKLSANSEVLN